MGRTRGCCVFGGHRDALVAATCLAAFLTQAFLAQAAHAQSFDDAGTPSLPPPSGGVLPRIGVDDDLFNLRDHLLSAYGETSGGSTSSGGTAPSGLRFTPQIGISGKFTDNVGRSGGAIVGGNSAGGSDFITEITPGILVFDNSERLSVNLNYNPTARIYARNGDFTQFEQSFNGDILATAVPDWAFVDLRGSASQQSVFGGVGPSNTTTLAPNDRETLTSVSLTPYLSHRFGSLGTAQIGYGYSYSDTDAPASLSQVTMQNNIGYPRNYGSSWLASQRIFASFTTGEDTGRLRNRISTDGNIYDGSGPLKNTHRIIATDEASYAVTRALDVLGEVGYEDLTYRNGSNPFQLVPVLDSQGQIAGYRIVKSDPFGGYNGVTGAGGVQVTFSNGSTVTLEYRYIDGFGSPYVHGSVVVSPRIRVFGSYSEGLSTLQQDAQNTLLSGNVDATGALASQLLAAPLLSSNNSFGSSQDLNRLRRLNITASYIADRDTVSLSFDRERTTPVGIAFSQYANQPTDNFQLGATLSHSLTPDLTFNANVQYSKNQLSIGGLQSDETISVGAGITRNFSASFSAYVRYGGTYVVSGNSAYRGYSGNENNFVIGALKTF